jgi:hypothetical protein
VTKQTFESWTPEKFETTGETPQDLLRKVELDELVVKYANDWLVRLFLPLGIREAMEDEIQLLMKHLHQPYDAVMLMPCSRRRRLVERVAQASKG